MILSDGFLGYGWEAGGFFSWKNQDVDYYAEGGGNGATIAISVDNTFWSFETFMGLYGSLKPTRWLRGYLGFGPLFLFATTRVEDTEEPVTTNTQGSTIIIDTDDYHSDFTLGGYARAGLDIYLSDDFWIGLTIRHMKADIDIPKTIGRFDIDGNLYFLTLTKRY